MIQTILLIIILLIGILTFKLFPIKADTKSIVLSAFMIVVTVICKRFFTVMIPFFGFESFKVGIEYIPLMLAGFLLSPGYAFLIGLSCDVIGLILVPTGFPFFGFTLSMILVGVIPSLISHTLKRNSYNFVLYLTLVLLLVLGLVGVTYVISLKQFMMNDVTITLTPVIKSLLIFLILGIIAVVISVILLLKKQLNVEESQLFALWALSVIVVEFVCTLMLTPLWLQMMYNIPFTTSLSLRIIKEIFIIPLNLFVGYILLKTLSKLVK